MKKTNEVAIPALLSRRQVAALLQVSSKTVYRFERRSLLTPVRVTQRLVRYSADEVRKLINK